MIFGGKGDTAKLEARIKELEAENARFRAALEFYANSDNWTHGHKYKDLDDATIFKDEDASGVDVDHGIKGARSFEGQIARPGRQIAQHRVAPFVPALLRK